jgi:phage shock protein C
MMATRERPRQRQDDPSEHEYTDDASLESDFTLDEDITDEDVEEYLAEQAAEAEQQRKKPGFWNLQTSAGIALIAIGTVYLLQHLGFFPLAYSLQALVALLPWLAGLLIILTGFGVLSWSPARRRKKQRRQARERQRPRPERSSGRAKTAGAAAGASAFEQARRSAERAVREAERRASRAFSSAGQRRSGQRRLTKSRRGRKIAGVAAGIADYLGVDPNLVRIAFVIGTIVGQGAGVILYLILAFVMPQDDEPDEPSDPFVTVIRDR